MLPCIYDRPLPVSYQLLILRVRPLSSSCLPPIHLEEIGITKFFSWKSDVVHLPADTSKYLLSGSHRTIVIFSAHQGESLGSSALLFNQAQTPKEITYFPIAQLGSKAHWHSHFPAGWETQEDKDKDTAEQDVA